MSKNSRGIFLIITLFAIMSVSVLGSEVPSKTITLDYYGTTTNYETKTNTLEDFLLSEKIKIKDTDTLNYELDYTLEEKNEISVTKGINIFLLVNGEKQPYALKSNTTIGNLIGSLIDETDIQHVYDGSYSEKLEDGKTYDIYTIRDEVERETKLVPFEVEYVEVDTLNPNEEEIIVYGLNGTNEIITTKSMIGTEITEETTEEIVLIEPITQVVNIGAQNKIQTEKGFLAYSNVLTMNASAYTAGFESTGKNPGDHGYGITASGMIAQKGVVAVDPNFIPLGTELYVENYGIAIAGDTGGAIKGNKIDLFYENVNDALNFGRRNVTVYVLQ